MGGPCKHLVGGRYIDLKARDTAADFMYLAESQSASYDKLCFCAEFPYIFSKSAPIAGLGFCSPQD